MAISCKFPYQVALNLDIRFDCAGSRDMYVCILGCSRSGLILGRAQARTKRLFAFYFLPSLVTSSLLLLPKSSTRYVASAHSEISICLSTMPARTLSAAPFWVASFSCELSYEVALAKS